ncbi:MAG: hypothetical protein CM15mV76_420 [uncultured marine virus]|nr:MAG: hypothetical protein CM15mV76_420 [uncultured marine virus]
MFGVKNHPRFTILMLTRLKELVDLIKVKMLLQMQLKIASDITFNKTREKL